MKQHRMLAAHRRENARGPLLVTVDIGVVKSLRRWFRRHRVLGDTAVPKRRNVLRVPALPGSAQLADDIGMFAGEVVLLTDVLVNVEELPAAVGFLFEVAPIDEGPVSLANRFLQAEPPE